MRMSIKKKKKKNKVSYKISKRSCNEPDPYISYITMVKGDINDRIFRKISNVIIYDSNSMIKSKF